MINVILKKLNYYLKFILFKRKWRSFNKHNFTTVRNLFPIGKVSVGNKTYGPLNVKTYGNNNEKLIIGSYCSIAGDVKFLLGGEHSYKSIFTFPFNRYLLNLEEDTISKGPIIIKDDVWIGENSLILSGVTIGQGAIIAAGSIVAKDVPPYGIFVGGQIRKYRFPQDIIDKLLTLDFSKINEDYIKRNIGEIYKEVNTEFIENILSEVVKS